MYVTLVGASWMDELVEMLHKRGAALVGFADLRELPPGVRQGMSSGVSVAIALNPHIVAEIESGPSSSYYSEYRRVNVFLNELVSAGVEFLEQRGHPALGLAATDSDDPATLSTPLPHKTVATRAALGWIGKCALLITERFGAAVRLNTILTEAELPIPEPINISRCGDCAACVEICPAKAPSGKNWELGLQREDFFDAFACRRAARQIAAKAGIDASICGICIASCPWTKRYVDKHQI